VTRRRGLSAEERRLWAEVARGVSPLRGRSYPREPEPDPALPAPAPEAAKAPLPPSAPTRLPAKSEPPPLVPLDRRILLALRRGSRAVDGVIDLHGMRQAEAHDTLMAFLRRSQAAGHGLVLVITGKGGAASGQAPFDERGVLRRVVPHWLRLPDLRGLVLGFDEASPHHGGAGALYVRLRRSRKAP
jgi:DNA-nicking Smr family endonuclease